MMPIIRRHQNKMKPTISIDLVSTSASVLSVFGGCFIYTFSSNEKLSTAKTGNQASLIVSFRN
jgi:hypothetical protein